jgi:hypothetical protein
VHLYTVTDTNAITGSVALRDLGGRHHVAHCASDLPPLESELEGASPAVGLALLLGPAGNAHLLNFSQIDCSLQWVRRLLHPDHVAPAPCQDGARHAVDA